MSIFSYPTTTTTTTTTTTKRVTMKRFTITCIAATAAILSLGTAASGASYPPDADVVEAPTGPVAPGAEFDVSVKCTGDETVTFGLEDSSTTESCDDLVASGSLTAPDEPGTYSGDITGAESGVLGSFSITAQAEADAAAAPAEAPSGGLPATGSSGIATTTTVAAGLMVVGLGLSAVAFRRRRTALV